MLTGDQPFFDTEPMPLRARHLQTPPPSVRARRPEVPAELDALVTSMLAKDASARPSAEAVYAALLPFAAAAPEPVASSSATEAAEDSDPTRPFRRPLLAAPAQPARTADERVPLTDAEAKLVLGNVDALMQAQHPAQAISLLEDAAGRAPDPALALDLRRALAAALFYAGEYTRAAALFDEVGGTYRRYLPPADPWVLDCAYHAGHAYAETGKSAQALIQLRYYVQHAAPAQEGNETDKIIESRYVIAQLLATGGEPEAALAELSALRSQLASAFGAGSTQVRNIDKQLSKLRTSPSRNRPGLRPGDRPAGAAAD